MNIKMDKQYIKIAGAMILPNLGGFYAAKMRSNIKPWYETLKFPSFRPPNWIFGPVWTALYSGIGYSSYLVWKDGGGFSGKAKIPLVLYGTQLILCWAVSPIFFGPYYLKNSWFDIQSLPATAAYTAYMFYRINPTSGLLLIPYVIWLYFESLLNYSIQKNNGLPKTIKSK